MIVLYGQRYKKLPLSFKSTPPRGRTWQGIGLLRCIENAQKFRLQCGAVGPQKIIAQTKPPLAPPALFGPKSLMDTQESRLRRCWPRPRLSYQSSRKTPDATSQAPPAWLHVIIASSSRKGVYRQGMHVCARGCPCVLKGCCHISLTTLYVYIYVR